MIGLWVCLGVCASGCNVGSWNCVPSIESMAIVLKPRIHIYIVIIILSILLFSLNESNGRVCEQTSERNKKRMERKFIAEPNYNSLTILYTYSTWFSLALNWLTSWLELVNVFCKWMNIVWNNLIPPQNFGQIQDEHLILNWFYRWNDNGGHKVHRIKLFFIARIFGNWWQLFILSFKNRHRWNMLFKS